MGLPVARSSKNLLVQRLGDAFTEHGNSYEHAGVHTQQRKTLRRAKPDEHIIHHEC